MAHQDSKQRPDGFLASATDHSNFHMGRLMQPEKDRKKVLTTRSLVKFILLAAASHKSGNSGRLLRRVCRIDDSRPR